MTTKAAPLVCRLHILTDKGLMRLLKAEAKKSGQSLGDLTREALLGLLVRRSEGVNGAQKLPLRALPDTAEERR